MWEIAYSFLVPSQHYSEVKVSRVLAKKIYITAMAVNKYVAGGSS